MFSLDFTDFATLLAVNEEILADEENRPKIKQLNPLDEVEVELTLLEADHMIEVYFERYSHRFQTQEVLGILREAYRKKFREHILELVEWAKSIVRGTDMETESKRVLLDQKLADDGWEVECESPLEIRNINGSFVSGQAASELIDRYRKGLRYGKQ